MKRGKLIVFEGGEGSGKSTMADKLHRWCIENDIDAIKSREPGGTEVGEDIRNVILRDYKKPMDKLTELLLFEAARREHYVNIIKPALDAGRIVILDRFTLSTVAIQGYGRSGDIQVIDYLNSKTTDNENIDCTFILDLDPSVGLTRIKINNRETNRIDMEDLTFHNTVRDALLLYGNVDRNAFIINVDRTEDIIFNDILDKFKQVIKYGRK